MTTRIPRLAMAILIGLAALALAGGSLVAGLAIYESRQAGQLRGQDEATRALKAAVLASNSSTDALVATLQEFVRQRPDEARGYALLGAAYLQKARETADPAYYTKADATLTRAIDLNGEDADALTSLGELALARHQFAEAIRWGERSLAINPYKARTLGVIGDGQVELGRYDEAFATFQKMVDLRPDLSSYARVSYARELMGDVDGAIEAMERAVQAGAPYGENTAYVQVQLATLYLNAGRLDEAEAAFQKAMRLYPNYKYAQAGVARVFAARGDLPRAIVLLKDVVDVMPLPEFVIALSDLYRAAGQPEEAARQDDLVRAMSALYQTNGVDLNVELAMFEADRGLNLPAAVEGARAALAARPSIKVASVLAWALYQSGRYEEAREASRQALRLGTKEALLHFQAGMIAAKLGDRPAAIQALDQALSINPQFSPVHAPEARRTLDELRRAAGAAGEGQG
jgi:tetratricopeptide (TPR) repeat protein